jgi:thioredoxin reductase
MEPTDAS